MEITLSFTLSAYMLDRFSIRSVIASLLLRTTISWPKSRRYRISVPFRGQLQSHHDRDDFRAYHNDWSTKRYLPREGHSCLDPGHSPRSDNPWGLADTGRWVSSIS